MKPFIDNQEILESKNDILNFHYDYNRVTFKISESGVWRYRDLLPLSEDNSIVTLGEGNTPLILSNYLGERNVYLKDETRNPTGAMKDRALSVAISKAKELGQKSVILASTGNAGISAATYAARAKIKCTILVPDDTPQERLVAMSVLGSDIFRVNATIEELIEIVEMVSRRLNWGNVSTFKKGNPYQAEAPKTIAYEIFEQLGKCPDYVFVPVGGGGTLAAIWRGFTDLEKLGLIKKESLPRMIAVHHQYYNSLEKALELNLFTNKELLDLSLKLDDTKECIAKNIQHIYCMDGEEALTAIRESGGEAISLTDKEILTAQKKLSAFDGIFSEASAASSVAAYLKVERQGQIKKGETVVCLISGSGYKEISTIGQHQQIIINNIDKDSCLTFLSQMEQGEKRKNNDSY